MGRHTAKTLTRGGPGPDRRRRAWVMETQQSWKQDWRHLVSCVYNDSQVCDGSVCSKSQQWSPWFLAVWLETGQGDVLGTLHNQLRLTPSLTQSKAAGKHHRLRNTSTRMEVAATLAWPLLLAWGVCSYLLLHSIIVRAKHGSRRSSPGTHTLWTIDGNSDV